MSMIERTCSFGGFIVTRTGEMVSRLSGKFLCVQRWHDALACGMLYQLQAHVESDGMAPTLEVLF